MSTLVHPQLGRMPRWAWDDGVAEVLPVPVPTPNSGAAMAKRMTGTVAAMPSAPPAASPGARPVEDPGHDWAAWKIGTVPAV